ncbi:MAG: 16S rRNA (guanine(527)-N(7))-methyltransferase RsmG [Erythrobacter sp.]|nr:16S rRNA (guanine(527)-N(7))-methyltransferase RsmG [Erythrobacter sp.]
MKRLERFVDMLLAENRQQNLISRPSEAHIWRRHIADSAQLLRYVSRETTEASRGPWLDLGTGAGFPGMVIAILRPDFRTVLVESRARRVEFLKNCTAELDLANCTVIGERLERIEPFESWVISARAFAPLEKLLRLSAPFSTKATHYILPKGRSAKHEWEQLKPSIRKVFHVERSLTDDEAGIIVRA